MKKLIYVVVSGLLLLMGCTPEESIQRPMEMWVFRSVLDEQPRMLTAALHEDVWVAYDVQFAQLYKAWKGGVNFDGAVYTTVHGPQPTSLGYAYFEKEKSDRWIIKKEDKEFSFDVDYKGHSVADNQLNLRYHLVIEDGSRIEITETPEFIRRGNQSGLQRTYRVEKAEGWEVGLATHFTSLMSEIDLKSTGNLEIKASNEVIYPDGRTVTIDAIQWLSKDQPTTVKSFFHPGFDKLGSLDLDEDEEELAEFPGEALIERSDCESCHNPQVKTVGPAYVQMARKYDDSDETIEMLVGKVIKGGKGVWGDALMTAHPDIMENDAREMVKYILSLDDNDQGGTYAKYTLGQKSLPIKLKDEFEPSSGKGWSVHAYKIFDDNTDVESIIENNKPVKNGSVARIHALNSTDFDVFLESYAMVFEGKLNIEKDDSYDFRLISDDGSFLYIDEQLVIDNGGLHGPRPVDGEMWLTKGVHDVKVVFYQMKGGAALTAQIFNKATASFELLDDSWVSYTTDMFEETQPFVEAGQLVKSIPGDREWLNGVHPSFDIFQARPDDFQPRVGGIDFMEDGRMLVCTWDSLGPVYMIENWESGDLSSMTVKRIAVGLAEPLGIKVVDGEIYVLQKQELTRLKDTDGDEIIDTYETVSDDWEVSANFHEFAFGLEYKYGYFYGALATAILPGGASANPQIPDRGKVVKIDKETGETSLIAQGLRTPNGIGEGVDGELFIADNQGDWLPASKIVHVQEGAFYGQRSVDPAGVKEMPVTLPVVWLPQDEIGNSPSTPLALDFGPYKGQMIHGEVTHGGVKRVSVEKVNGQYQGAVFRFTQGIEAGVNRLSWAPDGSLMVGGIGVSGNWGQTGKLKYGLQRLVYNEQPTFEMLSVSAHTDGFEITFTEPIMAGQYIRAEDFEIQQWYYKPTADYGGPKLGLTSMKPSRFSMSEDRRKVRFTIPGLKENHMVYFRIVSPFISESGQELWSTETWYTLNQIPQDKFLNHNDYKVAHNTLTNEEAAAGWKLLFDGESTSGIRNYNKSTLGKKWRARNGTLDFAGKGDGDGWQAREGGDIVITDQTYEDYEFYMEWKVSTGGNSGIIFNVEESDKYDYPWLTGPEMQILDNVQHPDGQIFKHRAGDLYDLIDCKFVTSNGPEKWNRVRIVMKSGNLELWQNGYKVVTTTLWNKEWNEMVENSKFKDMDAFGSIRSGHIVLQDHGDRVAFRNIKIRAL